MDAAGFSTVGHEPWLAQYDTNHDNSLSGGEWANLYPGDIATLVDSDLSLGGQRQTDLVADMLVSLPDTSLADVLYWLPFDDINHDDRAQLGRTVYQRVEEQRPGRFADLLLAMKDRPRGPGNAFNWEHTLGHDARGQLRKHIETRDPEFALRISNDTTPPAGNADTDHAKINTEPKDPASLRAQSLSTVVGQLLDENQVIIFGEDHDVFDEHAIMKLIDQAKAAGVRTLAIEWDTTFQAPWDEILARKRDPLTQYPAVRSQGPLLQAAHDAGIKVVAIDHPGRNADGEFGRSSPMMEARDRFMAMQIRSLAQQGKVMVVVGATHAVRNDTPYRSLPTILEDMRVKTASIKLENSSPSFYNHAYHDYFANNTAPRTSFAVWSRDLPANEAFPADVDQLSRALKYRDSTDAVVFLGFDDQNPEDTLPAFSSRLQASSNR